MSSSRGTPRPFTLLAAITALAALATVVASAVTFPIPLVPALVLLVAAILLSENYALELPRVGSVSLAYPLTIATIVLLGPSAAALASAFSGFNWADVRERRPLPILVYNTGQVVLCSALSAWLYVWLGGRVLVQPLGNLYGYAPLEGGDFPRTILALAIGALVGIGLNITLVGVGWYFFKGSSPLQVMREALWTVPTQAALAAVGLTIAQVLAISTVGFLLFVFPLLVARGVYRHYVELRSAFTDTIRFFVRILEAKDPYTRGHSERVAEYAVEIGHAVGLSPKQLESLEVAALLHDTGKLIVPQAILNKPGRLDDHEYAVIRAHPRSGAEIVRKVPYLEHLGGLIEAHHEAFDGSGYCAGMSGLGIPYLARILAVADSFDAMTTVRPYRPAMTELEAYGELRRCASTQFDPEVVSAWLNVRIAKTVQTSSPVAMERVAVGSAK